MVKRIFFPLLLSFFIGSTSIVKAWSFKKKKTAVNLSENSKDKEISNNGGVDIETQKIIEQNEKYQQQRSMKTVKKDDSKTEEDNKQELLELQKKNQERENKEIQTDKFLATGVSGDELVGKEFAKWSTVKAKMSSKDFKRMYLENIKMKRIKS